MSKIKVGSIGIGGISRYVHLPGIEKSPDLELVAACDIDPEALEYAKVKYRLDDARCFRDYHDLIRCPDVEAVDISTPNDCHFEIAMAAVEAGKPYALEKPVAMNAGEADRLAAATRAKGLPNMVCFSYRFKGAARRARDLIRQGAIGQVYHVDIEYCQAWGIPDAGTGLVWRFIRAKTGSGTLGDLGSHAFDLVRFVTGKECVSLVSQADVLVNQRRRPDGGMGRVDVDDYCNCLLKMDGGTSGTIRVTRFGYGRGNFQRMEIYGSKGAMEYTLDLAAPDVDELYLCIGEEASKSHTFKRAEIPEGCRADQMQSFADVINGRGDGLAADIRDGRTNQHSLDAAVESYRKSVWVPLKQPE